MKGWRSRLVAFHLAIRSMTKSEQGQVRSLVEFLVRSHHHPTFLRNTSRDFSLISPLRSATVVGRFSRGRPEECLACCQEVLRNPTGIPFQGSPSPNRS